MSIALRTVLLPWALLLLLVVLRGGGGLGGQ